MENPMPLPVEITGKESRAGDGGALDALIDFYRSFNASDLNALAANWADGEAPSMDNPIGGIRRGWPAIKEGYAKLFNGSATVRVAFHDFVAQGNNDFHLFVGREKGYCETAETISSTTALRSAMQSVSQTIPVIFGEASFTDSDLRTHWPTVYPKLKAAGLDNHRLLARQIAARLATSRRGYRASDAPGQFHTRAASRAKYLRSISPERLPPWQGRRSRE